MSGSVAERLAAIRQRIDAACQVCGRDPAGVELLAVSKTRGADEVRAAHAVGQRAFGENRVQELGPKALELTDLEGLGWHFIGSVQTNKVRALLEVGGLVLLHSLDRPKLAEKLGEVAAETGRRLDVLLQVNATGEDQKHGVAPADAEELARRVLRIPQLGLRGLMAMGPLEGPPEPVFATVARLREQLQDALGQVLPVLSLGMTDDLEPAVAAGSTLVRVGTGVFGLRG